MARLVVETSEGITLSFDLAGVGSRCAAGVIDLFLWATAVLFAFFAVLVAQSLDPTGLSQFATGVLAGGVVLSLVLYHALLPALWDGRTPGKSLLGLRVRDVQGRPATRMQHLLRALFFPLELGLTVPISLGILVMASTERGQRLGDLVAGTVVLRDPRALDPVEPYPRATWAELPSRRLGLSPSLTARLDGEDLRYLRELLGRTQLEERAAAGLMKRSARHYAGVLGVELGSLDARAAREVLRELYLFLREQSRFLREQGS